MQFRAETMLSHSIKRYQFIIAQKGAISSSYHRKELSVHDSTKTCGSRQKADQQQPPPMELAHKSFLASQKFKNIPQQWHQWGTKGFKHMSLLCHFRFNP